MCGSVWNDQCRAPSFVLSLLGLQAERDKILLTVPRLKGGPFQMYVHLPTYIPSGWDCDTQGLGCRQVDVA